MKRIILAAGCASLLSMPAFAASVEASLNEDISEQLVGLFSGIVASDVDLGGIAQDGISAVPLPAAGLMLLAGLGGLAALRRRTGA